METQVQCDVIRKLENKGFRFVRWGNDYRYEGTVDAYLTHTKRRKGYNLHASVTVSYDGTCNGVDVQTYLKGLGI